jgi:uncharacterized membrane protein YphA (DoxX/SURF4 family)
MELSKATKRILLIFRVVIALILLQTLRFKFTGAPDAVYIFTKVGMEPYGRIGIGILELIASILILVPRTIILGSLLAFGLMIGAIGMHLTKLGIKIHGDASLFFMAITVFILSGIISFAYRKQANTFFKK